MRIGVRVVFAVFAVASFTVPVCAQSGEGADAACPSFTMRAKDTTVQVLANGTTITRESTHLSVQDSAGRSLTVLPIKVAPGAEEQLSFFLRDPVARTVTTWRAPDPAKKLTVTPMQVVQACTLSSHIRQAKQPVVSTLPEKNEVRTDPKSGETRATEHLGTQMIQGLEAYGTRTTLTIPRGAIGNDAPLTSIWEEWVSPLLGMLLRQVSDSPQTGTHTMEVVELNQGEPDPSVFKLPSDYEIVVQEQHPLSHKP